MPVFEESFKLSNQNPDHPQLIQVCSEVWLHHSHKSACTAFQHWHASCVAMVLRFRKDCWPGTSLTSHAELTWCSQSVINDDRQSAQSLCRTCLWDRLHQSRQLERELSGWHQAILMAIIWMSSDFVEDGTVSSDLTHDCWRSEWVKEISHSHIHCRSFTLFPHSQDSEKQGASCCSQGSHAGLWSRRFDFKH